MTLTGTSRRWPSYAQRSNAELVEMTREGDAEAFGELYGRYRDFASKMGRLLAPAQDPDQGMDVASAAMLSTYLAIINGGGPTTGNFGGYLMTALRSAAINVWRGQPDCRALGFDGRELVTLDDTQRIDDVDDRFWTAFNSLPERWRQLLIAVDVDGVAVRDVSVELGISPNAAAAVMFRARRGLRRALAGLGDAD